VCERWVLPRRQNESNRAREDTEEVALKIFDNLKTDCSWSVVSGQWQAIGFAGLESAAAFKGAENPHGWIREATEAGKKAEF